VYLYPSWLGTSLSYIDSPASNYEVLFSSDTEHQHLTSQAAQSAQVTTKIQSPTTTMAPPSRFTTDTVSKTVSDRHAQLY